MRTVPGVFCRTSAGCFALSAGIFQSPKASEGKRIEVPGSAGAAAWFFLSDGYLPGWRQSFSQMTAPWQRCQFHFSENIADRAPKKYQAGLCAKLQEMFNSKSAEEARKKRDSIIGDYKDVAESAMACLDERFESSMTARMLSYGMYRHYRTSNRIERINRELKGLSKVIGVFPNEASVVRLMGSVLMKISGAAQGANMAFSRQYFRSVMDSEVPSKLKAIAKEQRKLLAAQAA